MRWAIRCLDPKYGTGDFSLPPAASLDLVPSVRRQLLAGYNVFSAGCSSLIVAAGVSHRRGAPGACHDHLVSASSCRRAV